jgi:hypothetical protein
MKPAFRTIMGGLALAALLPLSAPAFAADYSARLAVAPKSHSGSCPHKFTFNGVIRANRAGRVQYRFIRSDGANAPVRTLTFDRPGAKRVSTTWTLGGPGMTFDGWQAIEIIWPQKITSNRAAFSLKCPGRRPGGPGRVTPPARRLPDLIVKDMQLTRQCKIRLTIANAGNRGVPESAYHKTKGAAIQMWEGSKAWGGIRLFAVDPGKKLKTPGGEVTFTWFPGAANLTVPKSPQPRVYSVRVDNNNAVTESDEGNNSRTERFTCRRTVRPGRPGGVVAPGRKRPDLGMYGFLRIGKNKKLVKWGETVVLTPSDATLISNGKPAFEVHYSYREFENVAAPGPFRNKIFFNGQLVSQQTNLSAGPKEIKPVHTQAYLGPRAGRLSINIDADNEVTESREDNNGPFTVNVRFSGF